MAQFQAIAPLKTGERPTLIETDKGNELIDAINALRGLLNITISPVDAGDVQYSEGNVVFKLNLNPTSSASSSPIPHNYTVVDASTGSTPAITVTPGNHYDSTGGSTWVPTIVGVQINAIPPPVLTVSSTDTVVWFAITTTSTPAAGSLASISIHSGPSLPGTGINQVVAFITVTITGGVAKVVSREGGVAGSQDYMSCSGSPLFGLQ